MKVVPECRYGHGPLTSVDGIFTAPQVAEIDPKENDGNSIGLTGLSYSFHLWRCRECGYIELFDEEGLNVNN